MGLGQVQSVFIGRDIVWSALSVVADLLVFGDQVKPISHRIIGFMDILCIALAVGEAEP